MTWLLPLAWVVVASIAIVTAPPAARTFATTHRPAAKGPATTVGRIARSTGHRLGMAAQTDDAAVHRRLGRIVFLTVVGIVLAPPIGIAGGAITALVAWWRPRRRAGRLAAARAMAMPELVDTLRLAASAGLTLPLALRVVATWGPPELRPDLRDLVAAIDRGASLETALDDLRCRWGPAAGPLIAGLVDHSRYGTPMVPALERIGDETRRVRRQTGESRIRRLPVTLLFPLVLCTLPAFGLLTVGPLLAGSLLSLVDGGLEAPASITEHDTTKVEATP